MAYFVILYSINNKKINNMKKQHINSLNNLLSKYSKQEIIDNIDAIEKKELDWIAYNKIFATDETAVSWFKDFCDQYNLTVEREYRYNRKADKKLPYGRYLVKELPMYDNEYKPYFMLWINDGHQNKHIKPHVEIGSHYIKDLWNHMGLEGLETKMHKICELKGIKKVDIDKDHD